MPNPRHVNIFLSEVPKHMYANCLIALSMFITGRILQRQIRSTGQYASCWFRDQMHEIDAESFCEPITNNQQGQPTSTHRLLLTAYHFRGK